MLRNLLVVCGLAAASAFSAPSVLPRANVRGSFPFPMQSLLSSPAAVPDTSSTEEPRTMLAKRPKWAEHRHWIDSVARCCSFRAVVWGHRCRSDGYLVLACSLWGRPSQRIPSRTLLA